MATASKPVYDSDRQVSAAAREIREIGRYRYLLGQLVKRDITTRYKRSVLGVAWTMINPLGTMLILSLVFSQLFKTVESYPVYILTGLAVWNFFSQGSNAAIGNLVWGGSLLNRIYIPRTIFGISAIGTALVNLLLTIVPLIIVMLSVHFPVPWTMVLIPIPILFLALFTLGWGLFLSALAVFFPDVAEMYQIVLTAWMYMTPIIYPETMDLPPFVRTFFNYNPMYWMVKLFRVVTYEGRLPAIGEVWPAALWAVGMIIVGWLFFTSKSDEYAYRV